MLPDISIWNDMFVKIRQQCISFSAQYTLMNHSMTWISGKLITFPTYLLFGMSEHCVVLISQWVKMKCICIKQFAPNYHIAMRRLMKDAVSWWYSGSHLTPSLWLMSCLSSLVRRCDFYICFPPPRVPETVSTHFGLILSPFILTREI